MDAVEAIVKRVAFRIYQQRIREGRPDDHISDWFEAKREIGIIIKEDT